MEQIRIAKIDDLDEIINMYKDIVDNMNKNNIDIWDDYYPFMYFKDDIENESLYVYTENDNIIGAFALSNTASGIEYINWTDNNDKSIYINKIGVNVNYLRKGIGSKMLNSAIDICREKNVKYLRLFVVDINLPATNLYIKNGFKKLSGEYRYNVFEDKYLTEYGFEKDI